MAWLRFWQKRKIKMRRRLKKTGLLKISRVKLLKYLAVFSFFSVLGLLLFSAIVFAWCARDLPHPDKVVRREGFTTKIFDRNGELLYDVYSQERRIPIKIDQVPKHLRNATIAIEDKNFYKHKGFDPLGWLRAAYSILVRRKLAGGSTLTQQLVKNVLLTPQRTITRKAKEFILSVQIEKKYSKDEILQMYLNEAPYGGTAWGVEAAAETYFGKRASELNLIESAILAGLPQRPSYYSPFSVNPKAYMSRTEDVLRRMSEDGYITIDEERRALKELEEIEFKDRVGQFEAPHFVMFVKSLLEERFGEKVVEQGGLRVTTTLDLGIQKKAQEVVEKEIKKVESLHITNGSVVVLDPQTGEILAMVGSKDYDDPDYDGKVNVALSLRQPGSAIKPVTYATALTKGYTPASMLIDVKTEFPGGAGKAYVPVNYDGKFRGPVSLRSSLGSSLNIPSVKLLAMIGVDQMLTTAEAMGLSTLEPTKENIARLGLSVTLGGGEVRLLDLSGAYSAFANSGFKVEPTAVLEVKDKNEKVLDKTEPKKGGRVLSEKVAYLVNHILSDNQARLLTFGANSLLNISGQSVAVKTGTTDDKRDNWTVGWTSKFLVGVWVGNNDNSPMKKVASGVSGASPIWREIVLYLLTRYPSTEFVRPEGVVDLEVDKISGYPAHDDFPFKKEIIIEGTEPTGEDSIHKKIKVCHSDKNKLATDTMVAKGDFEEREMIVLKESDPVSSDGRNRWQEGIDAWIAGQGDERYRIPTEYCGESTEVIVDFEKPKDKERIDNNEVEVDIRAVANKDIKKVELFVDGELKETFNSKPFRVKIVLSDGSHTLRTKAYDEEGNNGEREIKIGVNKDWDWSEEPSPSLSPSPSPELSPSPSPSPTPSPTLSP